ncbi:hypothetical protein BP6252_11875 [Coleophoma cylindrospora]|uniref:SET domain-containing protein n=1 Tax=Coleophoma cylindrospora TaxID=1849047 RepID=A0A3D8QKX5_9HELO|nr:hypothetical protein BP6252_11875 [Coleophoma cylindrospora]
MTTPIEYIVDDIVLRSPETLGILIEVQRSVGKGYGVFATKNIPVGSLILSEAPLVVLIDHGSRVDPLDTAVNALSPARRKAYRRLCSYRHRPSETLNRSILYSNGFAVGETTTGVFELASRINHSCTPNCAFAWNEELGTMVFKNCCELSQGQELTINYGHHKGHLKKFYGFECDCGSCTE